MANLTLADLQNEVAQHTQLDITNATILASVNRWINYTQQEICARWPWTFMLGRESIVTIPDYSTGTVSVSSGSTTITGSSTVFTTTHGDGTYYLQFTSANDWYRVTARSSNTALTIEQPYQGTTSLSGSTYILRKIFYSLSSTADRIIDIRNWNTPCKLFQVDPRTLDDLRPNPESTNSSYGYVAYGVDASGNIVISPYPFPSDARLFEIRTTKRPTDMAATTDSPSIPNKYAHVIAFGALAVAFASMRKSELAMEWNSKFEQKISDMQKLDRRTEDYQPILRSIDSVQRSKWIQMPDTYPVITSG